MFHFLQSFFVYGSQLGIVGGLIGATAAYAFGHDVQRGAAAGVAVGLVFAVTAIFSADMYDLEEGVRPHELFRRLPSLRRRRSFVPLPDGGGGPGVFRRVPPGPPGGHPSPTPPEPPTGGASQIAAPAVARLEVP